MAETNNDLPGDSSRDHPLVGGHFFLKGSRFHHPKRSPAELPGIDKL